MFAKIRNSWALVKASAAVLKADKELILFPVLSVIAVILVSLTFIVPFIISGMVDSVMFRENDIMKYVVLFLFYFIQYTIVIFSNSALVGAAIIRLRGGDPTVKDGFRIAFSHIKEILGYAVIAASVGMILRTISERSGLLGKIVSGILGMIWSLATFLVVPILVIENVSPVEAIKRSTQLLKKTWGEQIIGTFSIGFIFGIIMFVLIIGSIPIFVSVASTGSLLLILTTAFGFILALILIGLISSTLSSIYEAALYLYASEGKVNGFFEEELMRNAFHQK